MKNIQTFEGFLTNFLKSKKNSEKAPEKSNQEVAKDLFQELKNDGYEFKLIKQKGRVGNKDGRNPFVNNNLVIFDVFTYEIVSLDGKPPMFNELMTGDLLFQLEGFELTPFISKHILHHLQGGDLRYSDENLKQDFKNISFDLNDPEMVEKLKNFIDQFELKVLEN